MLNELGINEDIGCQATNLLYNDECNMKSTMIPSVSETKVFILT